jgi:hypothetical protein
MAYRILFVPEGDSLVLVVRVRKGEFGEALATIATGRTFAFAAKTDLSIADQDAEVFETSAPALTTDARDIRVNIPAAALAALTPTQCLHWALKSELTASGIVRTRAHGLLARASSALSAFPSASAVIVDNDGTVLIDNDGTPSVDN